MMDGLIVVNKAKGMTSHDVVNKIRKIFKTKQVGHLGTLDPLATGVLVVCLNKATKLVPFLESADKKYLVEVMLGISSDTYDIEGTILEDKEVKEVNLDELDENLYSFIGKSEQLPPIYSAIKVNGKKLYDYARKKQEVNIPKRMIEVYSLKRITNINYQTLHPTFSFEIHVSKGTYIRSICHDLGKKLNLPCLMSNLQRIASGHFTLDDAKTIEQIEKGDYKLFSMLDVLQDYPLTNDAKIIQKAKNGQKISSRDISLIFNYLPKQIVIYEDTILIAIYEYDQEIKGYKASRVWN